jgi:hypothetical protein
MPSSAPTGTAAQATPAPTETIPQPVFSTDLSLAPDSQRVDLAVPVFSHPFPITNSLFPVSSQDSVLMLGHVDGKPFRTEVTLLPYTRIIEWNGQRVGTVVSQYNAFLDGRIDEIAYDYYAQADDGSVWYFGEDVFDFRDGTIVVTEGTWLAGRDGPAAMIMPASPQAGNAYRTENAPPFVFEEVTVRSAGTSLDGPLGTVSGGLVVRELHMDGTTEDKTFAPGYGEFFTGGGGDVEALALAVPTDAAPGPMPPELATMSDGALAVYEAAGSGRWDAASSALSDVSTAWGSLPEGEVPRLIEPALNAALARLIRAVEAHQAVDAQNAAIATARSAFDLQLRYRPVPEIDLARLDLWAAQLLVDAAADDAAGVGSDQFAMDYVRDRITAALGASDLARVNVEIGAIQSAVVEEDLGGAAEAATNLRTVLAGVAPVS